MEFVDGLPLWVQLGRNPKTFIAIAYHVLLILARNDGARFPINRQALMKDTVDALEKMLLMLFRFIIQ